MNRTVLSRKMILSLAAIAVLLFSTGVLRAADQQTVLYSFNGTPDGATPYYGNLIFDSAGRADFRRLLYHETSR